MIAIPPHNPAVAGRSSAGSRYLGYEHRLTLAKRPCLVPRMVIVLGVGVGVVLLE